MGVYLRVEPQPITTAGIYHNSDLGLISLSSDGSTWLTISDKNLGATQVYNDGDTLSEANCGKYYQWGNNYGFPFTGAVTTSSTQVDASTYGPGNYYSSSTFITGSNDWFNNFNKNLWGDTTNTNAARQGPCPSGYHIPSYNEMTDLYTTIMTTFGLTWQDAQLYTKMPNSGWRAATSGDAVQNGRGFWWTSTLNPDLSEYKSGYVMRSNSNLDVHYSRVNFGLPIRPFANTPTQPDETRTVLYQPS